MGPILLDNVTCDQSHSELLQCVHLLDIGIHNCDRENVGGAICPNVSTTPLVVTTTTTTAAATESAPRSVSPSTIFVGNTSSSVTTSIM